MNSDCRSLALGTVPDWAIFHSDFLHDGLLIGYSLGKLFSMPLISKIRKYVRASLPKGTLIAWEHLGVRKVSYISVLSLGGLFISTPQPPPAGGFIKLIFEVAGGDIQARAEVRDSQPGKGMGIHFVSMAQVARARLTRHMNALLSP